MSTTFPLLPRRCAALCLLAVAGLLTALAPGNARSQSLPDGAYKFSVQAAPVLLYGRYAFTANEQTEGRLTVKLTPKGVLKGQVSLLGFDGDAKGSLISRKRRTRLALHGVSEEGGQLDVACTLQGNVFVGTVSSAMFGSAPCRLDAAGLAPLTLKYAVNLSTDPAGNITGEGALRAAGRERRVQASGTVKDGLATLLLTAGSISFQASGPVNDAGFSAKWKAVGFGAVGKGNGLEINRTP